MDSNLIVELKKALDEFYHPGTSNDRKRSLERNLSQFKGSAECLNIATIVIFEHSSDDPNLTMFCLHAFHEIVERKWPELNGNQKETIVEGIMKKLLQQRSISSPESMNPGFLGPKLTAVFALIAAREWPETFEQFPNVINQWLSDSNTASIALSLLRCIVQELWSPSRRILSGVQITEKQQAFKKIIYPNALRAIQEIMMAIVKLAYDEKHLVQSVGSGSDSAGDYRKMIHGFIELVRQHSSGSATSRRCHQIPIEALNLGIECIQTLLTFKEAWILSGQDLSLPMGTALIGLCLYEFSGYHCAMPSVALQLIAAVTPIVIPQQSDTCMNLTDVYGLICALLQTGSVYNWPDMENSEQFRIQLIETLRNFVHSKLHLLLPSSNSMAISTTLSPTKADFADQQETALMEFLGNLCSFTDAQTNPMHFVGCLEVWKIFVEGLAVKLKVQEGEQLTEAQRKAVSAYAKVFTSVVGGILDKLTTDTHGLLASFDGPHEMIACVSKEKTVNDVEIHHHDVEGDLNWDEWSGVVDGVAELFLVISWLSETLVFNLVLERFNHTCSLLNRDSQQQQDHHQRQNNSNVQQITAASNNNPWNAASFQLYLSLLSRLSFVFAQQHATFFSLLDSAKALVQRLSGVVLALRSWSHWMLMFYAQSQRSGEGNEYISPIITSALNTSVTLIVGCNQTKNVALQKSAVSCLYSLLLTVRPHAFVLSNRLLLALYDSARSSTELDSYWTNLGRGPTTVLYTSLSNYLILPWFEAVGEEDQHWSERKAMYAGFMAPLVSIFPQTAQVLEMDSEKTIRRIQILSASLENIADENVKTKTLAYNAAFKSSHSILPLLLDLKEPILTEMIGLLGELLRVLPVQLGPEFVKDTVDLFLQISSKELSHRVTEFIIEISSNIAKEMSAAFSSLTDSLLSLAWNNMRPIIQDNLQKAEMVDSRRKFFQFVYALIDSRWRHFFPSPIQVKENLPPWLQAPEDAAEKAKNAAQRTEYLVSLFQMISQSLVDETVPEIRRNNLKYIDQLQTKWSLFKKPLFLERIWSRLVADLLRAGCIWDTDSEDICHILALVITNSDPAHLQLFNTDLLPSFVRDVGVGVMNDGSSSSSSEQERILNKFRESADTDLPTLTTALNVLVQECRIISSSP